MHRYNRGHVLFKGRYVELHVSVLIVQTSVCFEKSFERKWFGFGTFSGIRASGFRSTVFKVSSFWFWIHSIKGFGFWVHGVQGFGAVIRVQMFRISGSVFKS